MKRKGLLLLFVSFLTLFLTSLSVSAATLSPALSVISHGLELNIDGLAGNDVYFRKSFFKDELKTELLGKVRVSSLPQKEHGTLMLGNDPVSLGDTISPASLDKLVFSPANDSPCKASFSFSVISCGISYDALCNIHMLDSLNFAPYANTSAAAISAFSGVCTYGTLDGYDPDGDEISFEVASFPKKGSLILTDSKKGRYVYTPNVGASGDDSFEYTVIDIYGNRSKAAQVCITLTDIGEENLYSDMKLNPAASSATLISELGIFRGERIGGKLVFSPEKDVTREEFLMMALSWSGIEPISPEIDMPYTQSAVSLGLISADDCSNNDILTLSEAAHITEKLAAYEGIKDEYVFFPFTTPEESLERLVFTNPSLFHLENIPDLPLSRKNAVSLVVNCIPKG